MGIWWETRVQDISRIVVIVGLNSWCTFPRKLSPKLAFFAGITLDGVCFEEGGWPAYNLVQYWATDWLTLKGGRGAKDLILLSLDIS